MGRELKRMNYFNGLLLRADDYKLDKEYQRRLQGFHNRYLHTWGIVNGLDVKPVIDSSMEVFVTEGAALDLTNDGLDGADIKESISREIVIYEGHPDNPIDLSEYKAGENIYISVSYYETGADRDIEKGQGEEIHVWERGRICHSKEKPKDNKKDILLARVVPREVIKENVNTRVVETVVDSTCIFDIDVDGSPLRVYAGPYARVLELEKFIFKLGEDIAGMPFMTESLDVEAKEEQLEINSHRTRFSGMVEIFNDLKLEGELISKKDGKVEKEFKTADPFLQVNSLDEDGITEEHWKLRDGGFEVFRGGPGIAPDARIIWSEADGVWKAGLGNELSKIAYGGSWDKLVDGSMADEFHRHGRLYSAKGTVLSASVDDGGDISLNGDLDLKNMGIWFRSSAKIAGIAWSGCEKAFGKLKVDGPVLYGAHSGLLGTSAKGPKPVLSWNSAGKVGVGCVIPGDDELVIGGSVRLLGRSNPVRFTSAWTAFPDLTTNQAEICNDTTYHKALMIVGNQSAGQGRKVAIWDRLDVNGLLCINGSMQTSQAFTPSAGSGKNGIIFPSDPGGGSGDGAWLKYYPRAGEACVLEIGTSNDVNDDISLMASGNVGIGSTNPQDKLDVSGWMRIMSGSNPIRFTSSWSGFPDQASNRAEICNNTSDYKTLMIVGNRSSGQGRKVSIWDRLDVNGPLHVTNGLFVRGAIIPGVGNCEVKGIMFHKDPYGGSGDAAWIRYYSDTLRGGGENMTLELGISNDTNKERIIQSYWVSTCSRRNGCGYWRTIDYEIYGNKGDRLRLFASGGTFIDGNLYYSSSKEYKENISGLCKDTAGDALEGLEPVEFNFKGDYGKTNMGFIAEDVPDIFAAYDHKAISPMEMITVLVNEVKEQEKAIKKLMKKVSEIKN